MNGGFVPRSDTRLSEMLRDARMTGSVTLRCTVAPVGDPRLLQEDGLGAAFNDKAQDARAVRGDGETDGEDRRLRDSWDQAQKLDKRPHRTDPRLLEEDALREEFDEAAQARRHDSADEGEGEDGRSRRKSWKQRAQEKGHRRGRGRGYGMKRDGD